MWCLLNLQVYYHLTSTITLFSKCKFRKYFRKFFTFFRIYLPNLTVFSKLSKQVSNFESIFGNFIISKKCKAAARPDSSSIRFQLDPISFLTGSIFLSDLNLLFILKRIVLIQSYPNVSRMTKFWISRRLWRTGLTNCQVWLQPNGRRLNNRT